MEKHVASATTVSANDGPVSPISTDDKHAGESPNSTRGGSPAAGAVSEIDPAEPSPEAIDHAVGAMVTKKNKWLSYFQTREFYIILVLGQILALCITGTNTFSSLLFEEGTSIPAFQSLANYVLLTVVYGSYTVYTYGIKKFGKVLWKDGWRYVILSFFDVVGNYCTVLAYRYTNILSAQLINFWAIVVVVILSFLLLRVRYRLFQVIGILLCCGGMGLLIGSDHITGSNDGKTVLKGNMFALVGATCYGVSNVFEEWYVSKRPSYEVLSMLGIFGIIINGVIAAIFDRGAFRDATWNGKVAGYLVGFNLALFIFYSLVPFILRMASAAFYNISLLTSTFWGVIIGTRAFGLSVHYLYPVAFVLIVFGLIVYFLAGTPLGESLKPWLGQHQQKGIDGVGTAKRRIVKQAREEEIHGDGNA